MSAPFPMVVGCGRSGTTLLRAMLNRHPDLYIPPESRFIPELLRRDGEVRSGALDPAGLLATLHDNVHLQQWELDVDDVVARLGAASSTVPPGVADVVRAMFRAMADRAGNPRYGDKSPPSVMHIDALAEAFPEAVFVHLVRDGRDVALAYFDAPFGPSSPAEMALHWRLRVERGRRAGSRHPGRYLEIRYEDLVASPEPALRRICELAALEFVPEMLDHSASVDDIIAGDRQPSNHDSLYRPVSVGLRDWRTQMNVGDVRQFELLAGGALKTFGYELSSSTGERLRRLPAVAPAAAGWFGHRLRAKLR